MHHREPDALECDNGCMLRHVGPKRPALITTAAESPDAELDRRRKRYAIMAVVFVGCFTAGALAHRDTVLALLLCGIAMVTLPAAVIAANVRSRPRRPNGLGHVVGGAPQLPRPPVRQPGDDR